MNRLASFLREWRAYFVDTFEPADRWMLAGSAVLFVGVLVCVVAGWIP